jgi:FecR protein
MTRLASLMYLALCTVVSLLSAAPQAAAQEPSDDPPAHISLVDGAAVLERDGSSETASSSMPLLAGDRLRTESGRVEVLFGDGSTLHLDGSTIVDFQSDEVIRLKQGRVRLAIAGPAREVHYRIDAPGGWVEITHPGEYRVSMAGPEAEVELAVLRGSAELVNEEGRTPLRAGERAFARVGAAPSYAYVYNSAAGDSFDRWSEARRDQRMGVSGQYLPETVRPYAPTFDQYGSWQYDVSYGYVWYPRVAVGWRPYYYGRWASLRPWGWTWIGADPWGWPTHHYGRWGFSAGAWFWIPGRTWGPAWVSWAYAPGYVSWCPLGWNNRAVFAINVHGGRWNSWHAWTVVPHQRFGRGFVNASVITAARIDTRTRSSFVVRGGGPVLHGYAVPRSAAPIRVAGTRGPSPFGGIRSVGPADSRAGFRDSRTGTAVPRVRSADEAAAAFRNRGSSAGTVSGPGLPQPSRTPRDSSVLTNRAGPADGSVRQPRATPSAPDTTPFNGRAVPRSRSNDGAPSTEAASPARRLEVPGYRRAPGTSEAAPIQRSTPGSIQRSAPAPIERSDPSISAPNRGIAVPRRYEGSSPRGDVRGVERSDAAPRGVDPYSVPADRGRIRSYPDPGSYAAPRAMPREMPSARPGGDGPPAGYRSAPGMERGAPSGPSGPPPGAQPNRAGPSGDGGQPSGAGGSRPSSGGQPTGGRAVPRGGGGRGGR